MASSFSARVFGNRCRALMAAAKTSAAAAADTTAAAAKPRGRPQGILKKQPISPALQKFIGASEASRTDAVKKVWDHIKSQNLQNPANKREIYCDDKLKTIFDGKDKIGFLEVASLLSKHFQKTG